MRILQQQNRGAHEQQHTLVLFLVSYSDSTRPEEDMCLYDSRQGLKAQAIMSMSISSSLGEITAASGACTDVHVLNTSRASNHEQEHILVNV
eukprot:610728-Pelagomonas_calceolata.AAC.1